MIRPLFVLIFCVTFSLAYSPPGQTLYEGCGEENFVCVGAKENVTSFSNSGCIESRSCHVMLRIQKLPDAEEGVDAKFSWELAVHYNNSTKSIYHYHTLFMAVSREKVYLRNDGYMAPFIPYWNFATYEDKDKDHFRCKLWSCEDGQPPNCSLKLRGHRKDTYKDFVAFNGMLWKKYPDSELHYYGATGTSGQVLLFKYKDIEYKVDLIEDKLTIALFHWHKNENSNNYYHKNFGGNFDPRNLFCCQGDVIPETEQSKAETNWTWLWIALGAFGFLTIIVTVILIVCCVRRRKAQKKSREGSNQAISGNNRSPSENSLNRKNPSKPNGKRLDYIAQLAGFDKEKPVVGTKTTAVKEHNFNESFHSMDQGRVKP